MTKHVSQEYKKERTMGHRGVIDKGIRNRGKGSSARILRIEQDE